MRDGIDDFYTCRDTVHALLEHFPEPGTYFDMSAGDGYVAKQLTQRGWTVVGQVDVAPRSEEVTTGDFMEVAPKQVKLVGFNPPFGRQAALAKRFLHHVCDHWQPTFVAIILPRSMRGTTKVKNYSIRVKEDVDDFYRPEGGKRKRVRTTFWLLERDEGQEIFLSKAPKIDLRLPEGLTLYPRTKKLDARVNMILRVQGANAGRDALVCTDDAWHVMKAGVWTSPIDNLEQAPWRINQRATGSDFALIVNQRGHVQEAVEYMTTHPDPREYVVPSMSRTWLCTCMREFYARI